MVYLYFLEHKGERILEFKIFDSKELAGLSTLEGEKKMKLVACFESLYYRWMVQRLTSWTVTIDGYKTRNLDRIGISYFIYRVDQESPNSIQ